MIYLDHACFHFERPQVADGCIKKLMKGKNVRMGLALNQTLLIVKYLSTQRTSSFGQLVNLL